MKQKGSQHWAWNSWQQVQLAYTTMKDPKRMSKSIKAPAKGKIEGPPQLRQPVITTYKHAHIHIRKTAYSNFTHMPLWECMLGRFTQYTELSLTKCPYSQTNLICMHTTSSPNACAFAADKKFMQKNIKHMRYLLVHKEKYFIGLALYLLIDRPNHCPDWAFGTAHTGLERPWALFGKFIDIGHVLCSLIDNYFHYTKILKPRLLCLQREDIKENHMFDITSSQHKQQLMSQLKYVFWEILNTFTIIKLQKRQLTRTLASMPVNCIWW